MDVETATTLVHIDPRIDSALNLDSLCSVSLLCIELTTISTDIHRLNWHQVPLNMMTVMARCIVWCGYDCLTCWIEAKVCLVQLLIEWWIDSCVVVGDGVGMVDTLWIELVSSILEQLVKNGFLLVIMDIHTLALDCTTSNSNCHCQLLLDTWYHSLKE